MSIYNVQLNKYEMDVIKHINRDNMNKIIDFLIKQNCDFIDELISDYLDLFTFEYKEFIEKYNILNISYNGDLLKKISENMDILEQFYLI